MSTKPVFAVVAGAYHREACLQALVDSLQKLGYEARAGALRSAGTQGASLQDDVAEIRENVLDPLINADKEVVLVLHSFAGLPGAVSAVGLSSVDRKSLGRKGGIIGIICLAAFTLKSGNSCWSYLERSGEPPLWTSFDPETGMITCKSPRETFYGDLEDERLAQKYASRCVPHSAAAFNDAVPESALTDGFFDGRRAYVRALKDQALPLGLQDAMMRDSGLEWVIKTMDSGHCPFASRTEELADLLIEIEGEFRKAGSGT